MRRHLPSPLALALIAAALAFASAASAQVDSSRVATSPEVVEPPPSVGIQHLAGGYLVGSFPQGDWGQIAGFGLALDGSDVIKKPGRTFGVRSSMGLLYNFSRTVDVP